MKNIIDFDDQIDVKLSTLNRIHLFHMDLPFIIDEISTNFVRGISMSNRWRESIKMCPLGYVLLNTYKHHHTKKIYFNLL